MPSLKGRRSAITRTYITVDIGRGTKVYLQVMQINESGHMKTVENIASGVKGLTANERNHHCVWWEAFSHRAGETGTVHRVRDTAIPPTVIGKIFVAPDDEEAYADFKRRNALYIF